MKKITYLILILLSSCGLQARGGFGSSFGGGFVGGFTGSMVGSAISQPRQTTTRTEYVEVYRERPACKQVYYEAQPVQQQSSTTTYYQDTSTNSIQRDLTLQKERNKSLERDLKRQQKELDDLRKEITSMKSAT